MNQHVLIVEDEAAIYERLRRALVKHHFSVDEYTKSYDEAVRRIKQNRPDVVLLDIQLHGDKTGIDLGNELNKTYKIPFIYVTGIDDDLTFAKGLHSNHEQFIVKTKPRLNINDVTRAIHTVIHKQSLNETTNIKKGLIVLKDYRGKLKDYGRNQESRVKVNFEDIHYFSTKPFKDKQDKIQTVEKNYCRVITVNGSVYYLYESLLSLSRKLPYHFIKVNEGEVINIDKHFAIGRINGSRIKVNDVVFEIGSTYKKELQKRLDHFYA